MHLFIRLFISSNASSFNPPKYYEVNDIMISILNIEKLRHRN